MTGRGSARQHSGAAAAWLTGCALPLIASPTTTDPWFPTRLVVLVLLVAVGLASRRTASLPRPAGLALMAGLVVFVVAALASDTPMMALLGRHPRYEGLPVVAAYAMLVWIGAGLFSVGAHGPIRHLTGAFSVSSLVLATVALFQVATSPGARVTGLLGNSSVLGTWGAIAVSVLAWSLVERRTWLTLGGTGAALLLVALSASRGAQVAVLVGCGVALLLRLRAGRRPAWWSAPALATLLMAVILITPTARARVTGTTPFAESTISGRFLLWEETLRLVSTRPFLGVGPSRFVDSIGAHHTERWAAAVGPYAPPDSPHNVLLQVTAAGGIPGLLAVLAVAVTAGLLLWRVGPLTAFQCGAITASAAALVAYLFAFTDPITTSTVCLLLGGALGVSGTRENRLPGWRLVSAAGVALVGLGAAASLWQSEAMYSRALVSPAPTRATVLAKAAAQRPWDPDFRRRVAYTLIRLVEQGDAPPANGLSFTSGLCEPLPGSVECLHVRADAQDLAGDPVGALATLEGALALEPTNVDTHLRIGIARAAARDFVGSEDAFRHAARLRPTAVEPWANLARLYRLQGRDADAAAAEAEAEAVRTRR